MDLTDLKRIHFSITEITGSANRITYSIEIHDYLELIDGIDGNFTMVVFTPSNYIGAYKHNGFINTDNLVIAWENSVFIPNGNFSIADVLYYLSSKVETIKLGNNGLELIAKLNLFSAHYEYSRELEKYTVYTTYDTPFGEESSPFQFKIDRHNICFEKGGKDFKMEFFCSLVWQKTKEIIEFKVLVYSPLGYISDLKNMALYRHPHIIANRLKVLEITDFLNKTITYLKASSLDELKLKISTFSTSLQYDELLSKPFFGGKGVSLKEK